MRRRSISAGGSESTAKTGKITPNERPERPVMVRTVVTGWRMYLEDPVTQTEHEALFELWKKGLPGYEDAG